MFVDQKYLDILPSRFQGVRQLWHKGCNVANWNMVDCRRVQVDDQILINGVEPIVFIHFTKSTIRGILNGDDALLLPYLNSYEDKLQSINPAYTSKTLSDVVLPQKGSGNKRHVIRKFSLPKRDHR